MEEEILYSGTEDKKNVSSGEEEILLIDTIADKNVIESLPEEPDKEVISADQSIALGNIRTKTQFSIKFKIAISLAILLIASLLWISFTILNNEKRELMNEMKYRAEIIAHNLGSSLQEGFEDDMTRHPLIQGTKQQIKDLLEISVYDKNLNFIDSSDEIKNEKILMKKMENAALDSLSGPEKDVFTGLQETKIVEINGIENFNIYQPVIVEKTVIGYAILTFTKKIINQKIKAVEKMAYIYILLTITIGLVLFFLLITWTLDPIKVLVLGVRKIATGNLRYKIRLKTKDELEMLAGEFNAMTENLLRAQYEIVEKGKTDEQIQIAEGLQKNLLPETYPISEFYEIEGFYKTARGMGGDYFDVMEMKDRGKVGATIADVSGKGVPAAVIMVILRTVFHAVAKFVPTPDKALDLINKNLSGRTSGDKYATMFYYMYDYRIGNLTWSNAGHNPMIVYHKKTGEVTLHPEPGAESKISTQGGVYGAPVGVMPESCYSMERMPLDEGDIIVLYTDGIPEAENIQKNFYGDEALYAAIKNSAMLSGPEILGKIISDVQTFVGSAPQHDDMTLLVMKIKKIDPELKKRTIAAMAAAQAQAALKNSKGPILGQIRTTATNGVKQV